MWDAITYPRLRNLLLAPNSSYMIYSRQHIGCLLDLMGLYDTIVNVDNQLVFLVIHNNHRVAPKYFSIKMTP